MKMTWEEWMEQVDTEINKIIGLGLDHNDLADQPYHDWYEDGVRPKTAAKRAIKDNGGGMLL